MPDPHEGAPSNSARRAGRRIVLVLTFLFVLDAVSVSTGLVVYTAWHHDIKNGLFALAFAVLSVRAALSWFLWQGSDQQISDQREQKAEYL